MLAADAKWQCYIKVSQAICVGILLMDEAHLLMQHDGYSSVLILDVKVFAML